jgi:cell division cycle 2-like protein
MACIHVEHTGFPITALRETNILLALQHPNIIRVREMVVGSSVDKVFMVMDYMENDLKYSMDSMSQPFTLAETKTLMLQLLQAVDHMHERWYIHRDLKTSNLLYSNSGDLVVCDFGMARKYGSPLQQYTFEVITLWYRPLELLLGSRTYSTAVDMWSVGCIFAEILARKPLFPGEGEVDQITKICRVLGAPNENNMPGVSSLPLTSKISWKAPAKGKLRELFPSNSFAGGVFLNDTGFDLLSKMLLLDPKTRISSRDALNHQWFTEAPIACPKEFMPKCKTRHEIVNVEE